MGVGYVYTSPRKFSANFRITFHPSNYCKGVALMNISAKMVYEYRKWYWGDSSPISGGSSILAIKRALQETNGDFEKACALLCETNDFSTYDIK